MILAIMTGELPVSAEETLLNNRNTNLQTTTGAGCLSNSAGALNSNGQCVQAGAPNKPEDDDDNGPNNPVDVPIDTGGPIEEPIDTGGPENPNIGGLNALLDGASQEEAGATYQNLSALGQTFATAGLVASAVTQDIIAAALGGDLEPDSGGLSPIVAAGAGSTSSLFMVSGYKALSHDGFSVSSSFAPASGKTPSFDEDNYGLTVGTRFDGSEFFGAPERSVTLGLVGNYTRTDITVDAPAAFPEFSKGGSAKVDSWSVGGYGLVTDGRTYGLLTVTGTYGSPETNSAVVPVSAEFDSFGVSTSAMAGVLVPVGDSTKLDLRGGLNYIRATSDDYRDSLGTLYTDGRMEEFSGSVSARLFTVIQGDAYNLRPFVQGGLTHRFSYENELKINSESFEFDDADTSVFVRAGVDFNIGDATQAYLAVRGDGSEDFVAIAAQVGVTFKLD